jgi:acetylornithine deacetylase/succinyl-diaminopimelate desuccinylase-like protein
LTFVSKIIDKTEPVSVPPRLADLLKVESKKLGYPYMLLPSGAGHDAQILADKADVAMIFIPSPDGISHSPQEAIRWEDLEKGTNLLLQALIRLVE